MKYNALPTTEINRVWPQTMSLKDFAETKAEETITDALSTFHADVEKEISRLSLELHRLGLQLKETFNDLYTHLQEFKVLTDIDEKFVR